MSKANPLVPVRFKWGRPPYQAGEVAGFPPEVAQRYIDSGLAEAYKPTKEEKKKVTKERKRSKRPELTKEMIASARASGQGGDYITKDE